MADKIAIGLSELFPLYYGTTQLADKDKINQDESNLRTGVDKGLFGLLKKRIQAKKNIPSIQGVLTPSAKDLEKVVTARRGIELRNPDQVIDLQSDDELDLREPDQVINDEAEDDRVPDQIIDDDGSDLSFNSSFEREYEENKENVEQAYNYHILANGDPDDPPPDRGDPPLPEDEIPRRNRREDFRKYLFWFLMGLQKDKLDMLEKSVKIMTGALRGQPKLVDIGDEILDFQNLTDSEKNLAEYYIKEAPKIRPQCRRFVHYDHRGTLQSLVICTTGEIYDEL